MATIDFPTSPIVGQTYKYNPGTPEEKAFIFKAGETGASDGYWKSSIAGGSFGPASAAEINAAIEAVKYIAPDQLSLSKFLSTDKASSMLELLSGLPPVASNNFATKSYTDGDLTTDTPAVYVTPGSLLLPGGIYLQWGEAYTASGGTGVAKSATVTFPVAYTTLFHIFHVSNGSTNDQVTTQSISNTGCQVTSHGGTGTTQEAWHLWMSMGIL